MFVSYVGVHSRKRTIRLAAILRAWKILINIFVLPAMYFMHLIIILTNITSKLQLKSHIIKI